MYFVCSYSKKIYNNIKKPITFSDIGKPLEVRYNWEGVKKDIDVDESQKTLWRYRSVLPKVNNIISLGEGYTPLQQLAPDLYVKNETVNPTGSFKDRGMSLAVTLAKAQGVEELSLIHI